MPFACGIYYRFDVADELFVISGYAIVFVDFGFHSAILVIFYDIQLMLMAKISWYGNFSRTGAPIPEKYLLGAIIINDYEYT